MKTTNMHRGILDFVASDNQSVESIETEIRRIVSEVYKINWFRGFAYGVVVQFESPPHFELSNFLGCVDGVNRNDGVLQWIIAIDHSRRTAFATHMWAHGYLHDAFMKTADVAASLNYRVQRTYKEKHAYFKKLDRSLSWLSGAAIKIRAVSAILGILLLLYLFIEYVRGVF